MSDGLSFDDLAGDLADMARELLEQETVQDTLDHIVVRAVDLVDGCEAAGILVVRRHEVETLAATDNVATASDRIQGQLGEGPCFDALEQKQRVYRIGDLRAAGDQWTKFVPKAQELGIGSMMGFLLYTNGREDLGALNLYSSRRGAFTSRSERVGWLLASHAAVALAAARQVENLHLALQTSRQIGEALGILMCRHRITEQQAFAAIVRYSQSHNTKVRAVAEIINQTGGLPS
jgi:transcriptional regulator with GAF, ATPase, and Fis domain